MELVYGVMAGFGVGRRHMSGIGRTSGRCGIGGNVHITIFVDRVDGIVAIVVDGGNVAVESS